MRHSLPYRMLRKRPMKLSTTVILMVSAVLFSVLLVVHLIYFSQISDMTRDGLANKALAVARTLADSPEIRQIQEALQYANQAQVTKPQIQQTGEDITQDTLFLLGSEALESMIKHEATRPLVFSPNYYQTRQNLLDIESLKVDDLDIHAYRYVMKPMLPIRRDSPKKAITLILAVLLGGMVGAGIVLGRNALRNYNAK